MHYIFKVIKDIMEEENVNVFIMNLDFILLSKTSALVEYIPGSATIDGIKRGSVEKTFYDIFK